MTEQPKHLTNETIRKKFTSQFELVNYAIRLAENMIRSGREPRIKIDTQNRAMQVLAEIVGGKDQFEELLPAASVEVDEYSSKAKTIEPRSLREMTTPSRHGKSDAKRARRAFSESL